MNFTILCQTTNVTVGSSILLKTLDNYYFSLLNPLKQFSTQPSFTDNNHSFIIFAKTPDNTYRQSGDNIQNGDFISLYNQSNGSFVVVKHDLQMYNEYVLPNPYKNNSPSLVYDNCTSKNKFKIFNTNGGNIQNSNQIYLMYYGNLVSGYFKSMCWGNPQTYIGEYVYTYDEYGRTTGGSNVQKTFTWSDNCGYTSDPNNKIPDPDQGKFIFNVNNTLNILPIPSSSASSTQILIPPQSITSNYYKHWKISSENSNLSFGSKVQFNLYKDNSDTNLYLKGNNTLSIQNSGNNYNNKDITFNIYALNDDGTLKTSGSIKNGDTVFLYSISFGILNNTSFIIYSPDLVDKSNEQNNNANIINKSILQLVIRNPTQINDRFVLCSDEVNVNYFVNNFDDGYKNVNYPFLVMSITQHERLNLPRKNMMFHADTGVIVKRYYGPPDYALLGDTVLVNQSEPVKNGIMLTFCKITNNENPEKPFCKPSLTKRRINGANLGNSGTGVDTGDKCKFVAGDNVQSMDNYVLANYQEGVDYLDQSGVPEYYAIGSAVYDVDISPQSVNKNLIPLWCVYIDYCEKVPSGSSSTRALDYRQLISNTNSDRNKVYNEMVWNGFRLFIKDYEFDRWCMHNSVWSVVSIYDRRSQNNDIVKLDLNTSGKWTWLQPNKGTWSDYSSGDTSVINRALDTGDAFLFKPLNTLLRTCYTKWEDTVGGGGNFGLYEQGVMIEYSSFCSKFGSQMCKPQNGDYTNFIGDFCQTKFCKSDNCDQNYIQFCNTKIQTNGKNIFPNYDRYPDLCACFMVDTDFTHLLCDAMSDRLGLDRNDHFRRSAFNLDYNNPDPNIASQQCNKPCLYNPLCGSSVQVSRPSANAIPDVPQICTSSTDSSCKGVKKPFSGLSDDCAQNICIQDINVDNQGTIGVIKASQQSTCSKTLSSICISGNDPDSLSACLNSTTSDKSICKANVLFSPCTGTQTPSPNLDGSVPQEIWFYKTILNDTLDPANPQICGKNGDKRVSVKISTNPSDITDVCDNNNKRIITYKIKSTFSFTKDVKDTLQYLAYHYNGLDLTKNVTYNFDPEKKIGSIISNCQNCEVDYESSNVCSLDTLTKLWYQPSTKTKITKQPFNGGKTCDILTDRTVVRQPCNETKDCVIELNTTLTANSCINGMYSIFYNIKQNNTTNGMTCLDDRVLLPKLKELGFDTYNYDKNIVDGNVKVDFMCSDCDIHYVPDPSSNNGHCFYDHTTNTYKIDTIPTLVTSSGQYSNCSTTQLQTIQNKVKVTADCSGVCKFAESPYSDNCNTTLGIRTIKHKVISNPTIDGVSCTDAMTEFAALKGYTDANTKVEFKNNELVVTMACDKKLQDCVINSTPHITCDDATGLQTSVYSITTTPINGGKFCQDVIKSYIPSSTLSTDINVNLDSKLITVKGTCDKKPTVNATIASTSTSVKSTTTPSSTTSSSSTKYILIGLGILTLIIFIVLIIILMKKKPVEVK